MEKGNDTGGLNHILQYEAAFLARGVKKDEIRCHESGDYGGKTNRYQGTGTGRPIVAFIYKQELFIIGITVGTNGYVVGMNLASRRLQRSPLSEEDLTRETVKGR